MKLVKIKDKYYLKDLDMHGVKTNRSTGIKEGPRVQKNVDRIIDIIKKYNNITLKSIDPPTDIAPTYYIRIQSDDKDQVSKCYNELTKNKQYPDIRRSANGNYLITFN